MSKLAVDGYRAERATILDVFNSLSDDEWNAPSDCAGWTIRDVAAHLASTIHGVVDPAFLPDMSSGTESSMEGPVAERRGWTIADVVAEYEKFSGEAANVFAMVQDEPMASTVLPMGELGTHTMQILPGVFLFDSYCHLRNDILQPHGPIERHIGDGDEQRLRPTVEWMLAGLPWMCTDALARAVTQPLVLDLAGPGGGAWTIAPGGPEGRVAVTDAASPDAVATIHSTTHDFVIWGTQRRPWEGLVRIDGDQSAGAAFCEVVNVI
jgi:uncharacterized protein (TIGR03083 family)